MGGSLLYRTKLVEGVLPALANTLANVAGPHGDLQAIDADFGDEFLALDTHLLAALLQEPEDIDALCADLNVLLGAKVPPLYAERAQGMALHGLHQEGAKGFVVRPGAPGTSLDSLDDVARDQIELASLYVRINPDGLFPAGNSSVGAQQSSQAELDIKRQLRQAVIDSLEHRGKVLHRATQLLWERLGPDGATAPLLRVVQSATEMDQWLHVPRPGIELTTTDAWYDGRIAFLDEAQGQLVALCHRMGLRFGDIWNEAEQQSAAPHAQP